nr:butyrophilin-like protein 9 [Pelodiscus sinensis]|eukprot:XP_025039256.1 butyrophilin-like protein 9 [Pelodiscus sinensis]
MATQWQLCVCSLGILLLAPCALAAVAPVFIDVLGPRGQGIGLTCRSAGWFPKPELQWVGKNQQNLATETVTDVTQDRENLYSVVSHVTVTAEDNGDIICIVRNGQVETEQQSAIRLSSDIFPQVSPWLAAFWALFTVVLIAAGAYAYREYTAKQKAPQKKRAEEEALLSSESEKEALEKERQVLREKIDRSVRERGFRRARSYMVPVTLDRSCTHTRLLISVGREGFPDQGTGARRWYWEVEVGDSPEWELGVLSKTVREKVRNQSLESFLEEGCWSMGRAMGQFHPSEADTVIQSWAVKPTVVGVFLDLEGGNLSFYSVNSMALILEIPVGGLETLFPFLSPGPTVGQHQGKPLSICPPSGWDFPQTLGVSGSVVQGDSTAPA